VKVRLPAQSFQVLAMLLEDPGELVKRDEIYQNLWPANTFVDFDHGTARQVNPGATANSWCGIGITQPNPHS
jgi:DNA-binding response OmpR family regulator